MATKRLARTIIEPGRNVASQYDAQHKNRTERAQRRVWCRDVLYDRIDPDAVVYPKRKPRFLRQPDKLGPIRHWLISHFGQPWNDVYSELKKKTDTRTVPGKHLVHDHLLREIRFWFEPKERYHFPRYDFLVDEDGILQPMSKRTRRRDPPSPYLSPGMEKKEREQIAFKLKDRKVGYRGNQLFWFIPTACYWTTCDNTKCWREHRYHFVNVMSLGFTPKWMKSRRCVQPMQMSPYRQGHRLTNLEAAVWYKIEERFKEYFLYLEEDLDRQKVRSLTI